MLAMTGATLRSCDDIMPVLTIYVSFLKRSTAGFSGYIPVTVGMCSSRATAEAMFPQLMP